MKPTRWYSDRQEKEVAKALGGRKSPNSGATAFVKGDVITDLFLIECKTAIDIKKSFSVKKDWLIKNKEEAFEMGIPYSVLAFNFGESPNYYILDEATFLYAKRLIESAEK